MAQVIQVEVRTGTTHTVTWLDTALKTKPMVLVCKGDPRRWSVVHTYGFAAREVGDSNIDVSGNRRTFFLAPLSFVWL